MGCERGVEGKDWKVVLVIVFGWIGIGIDIGIVVHGLVVEDGSVGRWIMIVLQPSECHVCIHVCICMSR